MRLPLFLLASAPLAFASSCPPMLEGLNTTSPCALLVIKEVDVACGWRNFTSDFWSLIFIQTLISRIVIPDKEMNGCLGNLSESVKVQYGAIEDPTARRYTEDLFKHYRQLVKGNPQPDAVLFLTETFTMMGFHLTHVLPVRSQIALVQATKKAFGVVETPERNNERIDVAMRAIERVGVHSNHPLMAELFPMVHELVKKQETIAQTAFDAFAEQIERNWKGTIALSHEEIVPAIETLYIQYHALDNAEAKQFVDWFLASLTLANAGKRKIEDDSRLIEALKDYNGWFQHNTCHSHSDCYNALSREARTAIRTAFPELFDYIDNRMTVAKWTFGENAKSMQRL